MSFRKSLLVVSIILSLSCAAARAESKDPPRSFSLSTTQTFAPGESVKVQLYAKNTPELEFRVYQVRDTEKFFAGLKDLHSFGVKSESPSEQIDNPTFIERLHDFKADIWWRIRRFFRGQFNDDARDNFRERQGKLGKRSQVVGVSQFARIPLLNESQLVARWKLMTPPAIVSETQQLPVDGLSAGVYLIEATDGTYKAYTVVIVTSIVLVDRASNGRADLYVADRKTGAPIEKAEVLLWSDGHQQAAGKTGADGLASLTMPAQTGTRPANSAFRRGARGAAASADGARQFLGYFPQRRRVRMGAAGLRALWRQPDAGPAEPDADRGDARRRHPADALDSRGRELRLQ